jgi:hypothetical protein
VIQARRGIWALALVPFILLATLNSAGYRYGASDQAFYAPAVVAELDRGLFPRDRAVIDSQARLTRVDETLAAVVRLTGADLPPLYVLLYALSLTLLAGSGWLIARRLYRTEWAALALLCALTLRHAIAKSGTNSLEAYFHPRQLAFGFGALAVAGFLHGRLALPAALVGVAALLHPTTALWFALWLGAAAFVAERRCRVPLSIAAVAAGAAGLWALTIGPLAGRLVIMDGEWLATLASKDYLFPLAWPLDAWLLNLGYIPVIVFIYRRRAALGLTRDREFAVVAGCLSLLLVFAAALPLTAAHVALAVQLQTPRIFWMLDLLAVIYAVWAIAEGALASARRARITAVVILLASLTRGLYVMFVKFPERPVAQIYVADDDWGRTMAWARTTAPASGWLADPMHAVKYGTSVRVAGERDVLVEGVKDAAIGMYQREIAMRTQERLAVAQDFHQLTPDRARAIGARYGLDYLVTEQALDLPIAFQSGPLRVYRLAPSPPAAEAGRPPR